MHISVPASICASSDAQNILDYAADNGYAIGCPPHPAEWDAERQAWRWLPTSETYRAVVDLLNCGPNSDDRAQWLLRVALGRLEQAPERRA